MGKTRQATASSKYTLYVSEQDCSSAGPMSLQSHASQYLVQWRSTNSWLINKWSLGEQTHFLQTSKDNRIIYEHSLYTYIMTGPEVVPMGVVSVDVCVTC